jgi:hypothetical protein
MDLGAGHFGRVHRCRRVRCCHGRPTHGPHAAHHGRPRTATRPLSKSAIRQTVKGKNGAKDCLPRAGAESRVGARRRHRTSRADRCSPSLGAVVNAPRRPARARQRATRNVSGVRSRPGPAAVMADRRSDLHALGAVRAVGHPGGGIGQHYQPEDREGRKEHVSQRIPDRAKLSTAARMGRRSASTSAASRAWTRPRSSRWRGLVVHPANSCPHASSTLPV